MLIEISPLLSPGLLIVLYRMPVVCSRNIYNIHKPEQ